MTEPTKLESALDELLAGKTTAEIVGPDGLLKQQLTKALIERAMNAEMSHHLGYQKHAPEGCGRGNNRNRSSSKKVQGDKILVPADKAYQIRGELFAAQALPKDTTAAFDALIKDSNLLKTDGMSAREWNRNTRWSPLTVTQRR